MRDKTRKDCERTVTTALNYPTEQKKEKKDVWEALKSTLCFNKGSPLILDVKLFVVRVCIHPIVPPHCRDATV